MHEVRVDWRQMEHVSEFKYLGFVFDELSKEAAESCREMANGRKVTSEIKSLYEC